MASNKFRLACIQMLVGADKGKNIQKAQSMVTKAVREHQAQMVMLPEMFNCPYSNASFPTYSEPLPEIGASEGTGETSDFLSSTAKDMKIWLVGGSIPEKHEGKLYNTCLVVDPEGNFVAKHRKVHLFDIDVPGGVRFFESETLTGGSTLSTFETPFCKMGVGICYDIRFPEYAQICQKEGCQVLLYPGAFNTTTGPLHWELLQRARAVDNQLWVATASPARDPDFSYQAWGHSTVVDPWGKVVQTTEHEEDIVIADIDVEVSNTIRTNIPILKQKRSDLYTGAAWGEAQAKL